MSKKFMNSKKIAATALTVAVGVPTLGLASTPAFADEVVAQEQTPIEQAEENVVVAEEVVAQAEQQYQEAVVVQENAVVQEQQAAEVVDEAQGAVNEAVQNVVEAANEQGIADANQAVTDANQAVTDANQAVTDANTGISEQEEAITNLGSNLATENDRLDAAKAAAEALANTASQYDLESIEVTEEAAKALANETSATLIQKQYEIDAARATLYERLDQLNFAQLNAADANDPAILEAARLLVNSLDIQLTSTHYDLALAEGENTDAQAALTSAQAAFDAAEANLNTTFGERQRLSRALDAAQERANAAAAAELQAANALITATDALTAADALISANTANAAAALTDFNLKDAANIAAQATLTDAEQRAEELRVIAENFANIQTMDAAGYFKAMDSDAAYRILSDPNLTTYFDTIATGHAYSATNIDNMIKSIQFVQEINSIRATLGLSELQVSDTLTAFAIANSDHYVYYSGHNEQFNGVGENLAGGYDTVGTPASPVFGWYDEEKAMFDAAVASGDYPGIENMTSYQMSVTYPSLFHSVGHYMNIIDPSYTLTGFGSTYGAGSYGSTHGQIFNSGMNISTKATNTTLDKGRILSADDYLASLLEFKQNNNPDNYSADPQQDYLDALAQLELARSAAQAAHAEQVQAQAEREAADTALSESVTLQSDAMDALAAAVAAADSTTAEAAEASDAYDEALIEFNDAQDSYIAANNELESARVDLQQTEEAAALTATAVLNAQNTLRELQNSKFTADQRLAMLEASLQILEDAEAAFATASAAVSAAVSSYSNSFDVFIAANNAHQVAIDAADEARAAWADSLAADAVVVEAEQAVAAVATEISDAEAALENSKTVRDGLIVAVTDAEADVIAAEAALEALQEAAVSDSAVAQAALAAAEARLAEAREVLAGLTAEREAADELVREARAAVEVARVNLAVAENILQELLDAINNVPDDNTGGNTGGGNTGGNNTVGNVGGQAGATATVGNASAVHNAAVGANVNTGTLATTGADDSINALLGAGIITVLLGSAVLLTARRQKNA